MGFSVLGFQGFGGLGFQGIGSRVEGLDHQYLTFKLVGFL